jgi:hypothetical protein
LDCHAGIILVAFITTLFLLLYLFILFYFLFFFMLDVGWSVLWCFNATFSYIAAIWWELVLLVEETGGQGQLLYQKCEGQIYL